MTPNGIWICKKINLEEKHIRKNIPNAPPVYQNQSPREFPSKTRSTDVGEVLRDLCLFPERLWCQRRSPRLSRLYTKSRRAQETNCCNLLSIFLDHSLDVTFRFKMYSLSNFEWVKKFFLKKRRKGSDYTYFSRNWTNSIRVYKIHSTYLQFARKMMINVCIEN